MKRLALLAVAGLLGCGQILGLEDPTLGSITPDAAPRPDAPPPPPMFTLILTEGGAGAGRVTSRPVAIDCPGTCSAQFPKGTVVTLLPLPNGGSSFGSWEPACPLGEGGSCDVTMDADKTIQAMFSDNSNGYNFVFVTKETYKTNTLSPLTKADQDCNDSAQAAGLPGSYVAWISSTTVNARDRIPSTARGWVRPDGRPFADRIADALAFHIYYPPRVNASGSEVNYDLIATGTDENGMASDKTCRDWSSVDAADRYKAGNVGQVDWGWAFDATCDQEAHIFCFGKDHNKPLAAPTATGRIAFVSSGSLPVPLGDITIADQLCQGEATGAGLTGTFKAFLAMQGVAPATRFSETGAPWVRPDGVVLVQPGSSLLDPSALQAPIAVGADKTYYGVHRVATGSSSPREPGTANTTCKSWSVTTPDTMYIAGHGHITRDWWDTFPATCDDFANNLAIFCLQQ